ncbi:alpha/beta fold hydrolase [Gimesia aquarii]|uniref:Putative carboxylesterase nap n=1 Tax=Gimesia aquarii TaxID=2527964 RepID=A0A517WRV8_9PLAN|nr:alpha/beta hydrolase [Gimesia aquarii]QDU07989.1 putative carboxylesterase nap [Gimesia aquarii]
MKPVKLAKSDDGFRILNEWHDRFESRLSFETRTERVNTSFGFTDVMITGPEESQDSSSIVILHGATAGAPFALGELQDLPGRQRFYTVNIPGQSTRAEQVRLDFRTDEYSCWLCEVLDQLSIERATVCGVSWGGSVALQLAKHNPDRISGLILVVPGSIVRGPVLKGIWEIGLPMLRFKLFPTQKNSDRAVRKIFTTSDEYWSPYIADAMRYWNVDFSVPPLVSKNDMASLNAPVFVIAADKDLSFPGEPLIARSYSIFPNLIGAHLLKNSHHCPSFESDDRRRFTQIFESALESIHAALPSALCVQAEEKH